MPNLYQALIIAGTFLVIALASERIGQALRRLNLPLISGFLLAGILAGPYVLGLISGEAVDRLRIVDQVALAFIAFAAGAELLLEDLRKQLKDIVWVTATLVAGTLVLGAAAMYFLTPYIPDMGQFGVSGRLAVGLLAGAVLVARSPSSAIALVKELRARGRFTRTLLAVTMVSDVVVIVLFAVSSSMADALLTAHGFRLGEIGLVAAELVAAVALAWLLSRLLSLALGSRMPRMAKVGAILGLGYGVFAGSVALRQASTPVVGVEILIEPLLVCMLAAFHLANFTPYRGLFWKILHDVGPPIYVAFFTLTGAALELDVLGAAWLATLVLFGVRLVSIVIGAWTGGVLGGQPKLHRRISWMTYVTQAGVGLGLAKEVAAEFPAWGDSFATTMIAVIVLNQLVGPPLFKWAVKRVGEAHTRGESEEFDGNRDAVIFGLEDQSLALARQLRAHDWTVRIATLESDIARFGNEEIPVHMLDEITLEELDPLDLGHAEAVIAMLSDDDNFRVCELVYENYGDVDLVVRLNERPAGTPAERLARFRELGALIVDPSTAMVSLMDHMVRSPVATSILLGIEEGQDMVEITIRNPALHGSELRDLHLPVDALVLSVRRGDEIIVSHGYTRLQLGDEVTVLASTDSLADVTMRLEG